MPSLNTIQSVNPFLALITIASLPLTTSDVICGQKTGSNSTCEAACLKQNCNADWNCNGSALNNCEQSCYHACTKLTCDEATRRCTQYCTGCQNMSCNSTQCQQHCRSGYCLDMACKSSQGCVQVCNHCRHQRCRDSKNCDQTCLDSDCSLECLQSQVCEQNCYGAGCSASCRGNNDCFQICHSKANCTQLICESAFCSQKCNNNSHCDSLRCHGAACIQETYVEKSKLECTSSVCPYQKSYASNTLLKCANNNGKCKQECFGEGCVMTCDQRVNNCEQYCYGGHCDMNCTRDVKSCIMQCPGGNCTFSCEAPKCLFLCKNNTCVIKANGKGDKDEKDNRKPCDNNGTKQCLSFILIAFLICLQVLHL